MTKKKSHIDATQIAEIKLVRPCYIKMKSGIVYDFSEEPWPGEQWDEWLERCGKKRDE